MVTSVFGIGIGWIVLYFIAACVYYSVMDSEMSQSSGSLNHWSGRKRALALLATPVFPVVLVAITLPTIGGLLLDLLPAKQSNEMTDSERRELMSPVTEWVREGERVAEREMGLVLDVPIGPKTQKPLLSPGEFFLPCKDIKVGNLSAARLQATSVTFISPPYSSFEGAVWVIHEQGKNKDWITCEGGKFWHYTTRDTPSGVYTGLPIEVDYSQVRAAILNRKG